MFQGHVKKDHGNLIVRRCLRRNLVWQSHVTAFGFVFPPLLSKTDQNSYSMKDKEKSFPTLSLFWFWFCFLAARGRKKKRQSFPAPDAKRSTGISAFEYEDQQIATLHCGMSTAEPSCMQQLVVVGVAGSRHSLSFSISQHHHHSLNPCRCVCACVRYPPNASYSCHFQEVD